MIIVDVVHNSLNFSGKNIDFRGGCVVGRGRGRGIGGGGRVSEGVVDGAVRGALTVSSAEERVFLFLSGAEFSIGAFG